MAESSFLLIQNWAAADCYQSTCRSHTNILEGKQNDEHRGRSGTWLQKKREHNQIHDCSGNLEREKMQNVHTENITPLCTLKKWWRKTRKPPESWLSSRDGISNGSMIDAVESLTSVKKEGWRTSVNIWLRKSNWKCQSFQWIQEADVSLEVVEDGITEVNPKLQMTGVTS